MKGFSFKEAASAVTLTFAVYFSTASFAVGMRDHASLGCMSCHVGAALQAEVLPRKAKDHLAQSRQNKPATTTVLAPSNKKTQ